MKQKTAIQDIIDKLKIIQAKGYDNIRIDNMLDKLEASKKVERKNIEKGYIAGYSEPKGDWAVQKYNNESDYYQQQYGDDEKEKEL